MKYLTSVLGMATGLWLLAGSAALAGNPPAGDYAGYDRFDVRAAHRSQPLSASVWYPAGTHIYHAPVGKSPIWQATEAYIGAAIAPGRHPLVVFSHGSGGNMDQIGWLSSQLALRGAIVLAVNHPGTTSGDSSPRRTMYVGQRSADISAALDQILANPEFAPYIDPSRISAVGFSLGGTTVLNLAGARFDPLLMAEYCAKLGDQAQDCRFYRKGGVDFSHLPADFSAASRDGRIGQIVAIEPGMTYAVNNSSLAAVTAPVLFIGLGGENGWKAGDVGPTGSNLVAKMKNASQVVFSPAFHLTFLAECVPGAAEILKQADDDDPVCTDPQGTSRKEVHHQIIKAIAAFLKL